MNRLDANQNILLTVDSLSNYSERDLLKIFKSPLGSPSLESEVCRLAGQNLDWQSIVSTLEGLPDPQMTVTSAFPPNFMKEDILKYCIYFQTLRQLKLINLQKKPLNQNGLITVYHGSTTDRKQSILIEGLAANKEDTGMSRAYRHTKVNYVFFYTNAANAIEHAKYNAEHRRSRPLLVSIDVNPQFLEPDLDNHSPNDAYKMLSDNLNLFEFNKESIKEL